MSEDFSGGRRGPVIEPDGKVRVVLHLDKDLLDAYQAAAADQCRTLNTLITTALRRALAQAEPLTESDIRRILREELQAART